MENGYVKASCGWSVLPRGEQCRDYKSSRKEQLFLRHQQQYMENIFWAFFCIRNRRFLVRFDCLTKYSSVSTITVAFYWIEVGDPGLRLRVVDWGTTLPSRRKKKRGGGKKKKLFFALPWTKKKRSIKKRAARKQKEEITRAFPPRKKFLCSRMVYKVLQAV